MKGPVNYDDAIEILDFAERYLDTVIRPDRRGYYYICTKSPSPLDPFWLFIGSNAFEAAGWCLSELYATGEPGGPIPDPVRFPSIPEAARGLAL